MSDRGKCLYLVLFCADEDDRLLVESQDLCAIEWDVGVLSRIDYLHDLFSYVGGNNKSYQRIKERDERNENPGGYGLGEKVSSSNMPLGVHR